MTAGILNLMSCVWEHPLPSAYDTWLVCHVEFSFTFAILFIERLMSQLLLLHNKPLQNLGMWNDHLILLIDSAGCSGWA